MKPPTKPYNFHPACLAFPLLADAELRELADDIQLRGLLQPVVVFRGQILDGRNRLAACEMARVAPRFTEWPGGGSPVEWVIATVHPSAVLRGGDNRAQMYAEFLADLKLAVPG